jgi:uncharacterized Zn-binding protein involved in type VI secretion
MRIIPALVPALAVFILGVAPAWAEKPGIVTGGSENVTVNGKPAARAGDTTSDGSIVEGSKNVFINGKPAAVMGGKTNCGGVVIGGGSNVFVNGKPLARAGDSTAGCK